MNKLEMTSKIREIIENDTNCGVEIYVCLKNDKQFFNIEKMVTRNELKDRVRAIVLDVLREQYLDDDTEYGDISDAIDNKKMVYVLEQSEEYCPFSALGDNLDVISTFEEKNIERVLGFIFKINLNSKKIFAYQQAYVGSRLQAKNVLRIMQKEDVFQIVEKEMLKIDKRVELVIVDNTILVRNVKVLQDYFGFQLFVRNQAQSVISKLEELDILGDIDVLKECQNGEKLTISKKLMKIKKSPVLEMDKDELIRKIPLIPRYRGIIHIEDGKIRTSTKKDVDNLLKLLNDDIVKSELTNKEYDSTSKILLNSETEVK